MPLPTTDGQKTYVTNGPGGGEVRASIMDADGSNLHGLGGDDILRGGKYDDHLDGGSGNDLYYGGDGSDEFRVDFSDIIDGADTDSIVDLDFAEGDVLSLMGFAGGTFTDVAGANATPDGSYARITSWSGLVNTLNAVTGLTVTATQKGITDTLILTLDDGAGTVQTLVLKDSYSDYLSAGGIVA